MTQQLHMRLARADEAPRVMEILEDGKRSIARLGIEPGQPGHPNLDGVQRAIQANARHVAEDRAGALLGSLALLGGIDAEYCRAQVGWLTDNPFEGEGTAPYLAIHRCATAAEALERGVMGSLFREAESITRMHGLKSIRIDTHPGNVAMRAFLAKQGFTELSPFELTQKGDQETDLTRIAYEKLV